MIIHETANCGPGAVVVQFGDHFRAGDHLRSNLGIISSPEIICGPVRTPNESTITRHKIQNGGAHEIKRSKWSIIVSNFQYT